MKTAGRIAFLVIFGIIIKPNITLSEIINKKEAIQLLQQNSHIWKQTEYSVDQTEAQYEQAQALNGIHLKLFSRSVVSKTNQLLFGFSDVGPMNVVSFGSTGIAMGYSLFDRSYNKKIQAAYENKKAGLEIAIKNQIELKFLLLQKYLHTQFLSEKITISDLAIKKCIEIQKLAQTKVQIGLGTNVDLARSEALLAKEKLKKLDIQTQLEKSKKEVQFLIGKENSFDLEKTKIKYIDLENKQENHTSDSPQTKIIKYQISALELMKESVEAEKKLNLKTIAEIGTVGTQFLGTNGALSGSVAIQLELPLLDGGLSNGKKSELLAQLSSLEREKEKVDKENRLKNELAIIQIKNAEQSIKQTEIQMIYTEKEVELLEKKIKIGSAGNFELISAQNNFILSLEANTTAQYMYELAKLNFFYLFCDIDGYLESTRD